MPEDGEKSCPYRHWIIDKYLEQRHLYDLFREKLHALLPTFLEAQSIRYTAIESRCKTVESLAEKLSRNPTPNMSIEDVTDLAGIRIILYYTDDVAKVGDMIRNEFEVDEYNSVDKKWDYEPHEFGYNSVHYIIALKSDWAAAHPEWECFAELKAEIQVRTLLQHAWAVISHDFDYKKTADVSRDFRRRLFRLSALLELADEESMTLKNSRQAVFMDAADGDQHTSPECGINFKTVSEFLRGNPLRERIHDISKKARFLHYQANTENLSEYRPTVSRIASLCAVLEIKTVDEMQLTLSSALACVHPAFLRAVGSEVLYEHDAVLYLLLWAGREKINSMLLRKIGYCQEKAAGIVCRLRNSQE